MANTINGTDGKDRITGTSGNDEVYLGAGNDTVYAGVGDDLVYGGDGWDVIVGEYGNDTLYGGEGNDSFWGGSGNDLVFGENGDDGLNGDSGDDTLDGGLGNDKLNGSTGNDTLIHTVGHGMDVINGEQGNDTLELRLTSADLTKAVRSDLASLKSFMDGQFAAAGSKAALNAQTTGDRVVLQALGVDMATVENVRVMLDGHEVPLESLLNKAPVVAGSAQGATLEDNAYSGVVEASDVDGDALTFSVTAGPQNGTLALDAATGAYTYTPAANWSGVESFRIAVNDGEGHVVEQQVSLSVEAVADAPGLSVVTPVVAVPSVSLVGDEGDNELVGGVGNDFIDGGKGNDVLIAGGKSVIEVPLDVAASLGDPDGSERLSITLGNLPAGAVLSAGHDNGDGTWTLEPGMLDGLTLTADVSTGFTLSVSVTASEANGSTATTTSQIEVVIGQSANEMVGGSGNDQIDGGKGGDVIYGGAKPVAPAAASAEAPLAFASFAAKSATPDHDVIYAGDGDDIVYGNSGDDYVDGGADNDWLSGGKGNDTLVGGDGHDELNGNSGDDLLSDGAGNDWVDGSSGDDTVLAGEGNDSYKGGSGFDTLDFSEATGGMTVDISKSTAVGLGDDTFHGFESYIGSSYNDVFKGSSNGEAIDGGLGNDVIRGLGGNDTLTGGAGNDTFVWLAKDVAANGQSVGVDVVTDFGEGDVLDLHDMLKKFKPAEVADHVRLVDGAEGSTLSVDIGGTFFEVAMLEGVHNTTAADLLASGALLA